MIHRRIKLVGLVWLLSLLLGVGCDRTSAPPIPLTVEELPAAFEKAFSKAKPEAKELANQILASVRAKDYSKAYLEVQTLTSLPALTKEQISIASRGFLTVNGLLQAAQAQGDPKAAESIRIYQETK